jgi:hypothetical protein
MRTPAWFGGRPVGRQPTDPVSPSFRRRLCPKGSATTKLVPGPHRQRTVRYWARGRPKVGSCVAPPSRPGSVVRRWNDPVPGKAAQRWASA